MSVLRANSGLELGRNWGPLHLTVVALTALSLWRGLPELRAADPSALGAVATEAKEATEQAVQQLRSGGNAVDAAVTAALVGGVVHPSSSGIGGGGFALLWQAETKTASVFDFRELAPQALDAAAFESRPFAAEARGRAVGVPGEVAGLYLIHEKFGKRSWAEVVEPAVTVARQGFAVSAHLGRVLSSAAKGLERDLGLKRLFFEGAEPRAANSIVRNPALARTLECIRQQGPRAFYAGEIARGLAAAAQAAGGSLTVADLAQYRVKERQPLKTEFEGNDVYTMPPPSAGGLMLVQALRTFSRGELKKLGLGSGAYQHLLAESMRASWADRLRFIGDPDLEPAPVDKLTAPARMKQRRATIELGKTRSIPAFAIQEQGTHHIMTADRAGNWVSLTTTVNNPFGAKLVSEHGVVLNDELDDFTRQSDVASLGLSRSPNRPRASARPVSSMTPTLVVNRGQVVFGLGGSGGLTIATNVTQVALARLVFDLPAHELVQLPRFFVSPKSGALVLPKDAPESLAVDLAGRGETIERSTRDQSAVQLIVRDKNALVPAADARKGGAALGE